MNRETIISTQKEMFIIRRVGREGKSPNKKKIHGRLEQASLSL